MQVFLNANYDIFMPLGVSIKNKRKWDHGSCCLHCWKTTFADENLCMVGDCGNNFDLIQFFFHVLFKSLPLHNYFLEGTAPGDLKKRKITLN